MPLTDRLERHEGLFLDSASILFFGGSAIRSGELPKDNLSSAVASLSSDRTSCLPLFCLTEGAGWLLPRTFSARSSPKKVRSAADDRHSFAVRPSVWHVPPASPPYPGARKNWSSRD